MTGEPVAEVSQANPGIAPRKGAKEKKRKGVFSDALEDQIAAVEAWLRTPEGDREVRRWKRAKARASRSSAESPC